MPTIHIIAGANGVGKSTISKEIANESGMPIVDPDEIAREINAAEPEMISVTAGRIALERIQQYINDSVSFGLETTLSGNSYIKLMRSLKEKSWTIQLTYIGIDRPDTNIRRVKERVKRGGHNVPIDDIRRRYERSLANLAKGIAVADLVAIYDNSDRQFLLIATIEYRVTTMYVEAYPSWYQKVQDQINISN